MQKYKKYKILVRNPECEGQLGRSSYKQESILKCILNKYGVNI